MSYRSSSLNFFSLLYKNQKDKQEKKDNLIMWKGWIQSKSFQNPIDKNQHFQRLVI
jgi:hypothetical protein